MKLLRCDQEIPVNFPSFCSVPDQVQDYQICIAIKTNLKYNYFLFFKVIFKWCLTFCCRKESSY